MNPSYPVYIVSKGRAESRPTSRMLEKASVPYRIVVEPQERAAYAAVIDPAKILTLPFSNLGRPPPRPPPRPTRLPLTMIPFCFLVFVVLHSFNLTPGPGCCQAEFSGWRKNPGAGAFPGPGPGARMGRGIWGLGDRLVET
jgi:hypothetical protein